MTTIPITIIDDFLDNVMLIDKNKIVYAIEFKKDSAPTPD